MLDSITGQASFSLKSMWSGGHNVDEYTSQRTDEVDGWRTRRVSKTLLHFEMISLDLLTCGNIKKNFDVSNTTLSIYLSSIWTDQKRFVDERLQYQCWWKKSRAAATENEVCSFIDQIFTDIVLQKRNAAVVTRMGTVHSALNNVNKTN